MALTELIFGEKVRAKIGVVQLDASISENHEDEADITNHPIEDGGEITDHIRKLPITFSLNGRVTNTPLVYLASQFAKSPVTTDNVKADDRVAAAYDKLQEIQKTGELVTVVTSLRTYESMAIKNISVVRNAETGNVLDCTLVMQEVLIVKTLVTALPTPVTKANNKAKDKGKKDKKPASEDKKSKSILSKGVDGIGKFLGF